MPLGIPYIAALRASGPRECGASAAAVMLSIIWTVGFWAAVPYIIPILVLSLATIKSARSGTAKQIWLLAALTAFAGKTVLALLMRPTVGILLSGVTEAVVGALAYALLYPLLDGQAERDLAYRETQWLLVILAATAAFDGVLWGISIRLFLSFFLIAGAARLGALPLAVLMGSGLGLAGLLLGEPGEYVVLAVLCASLTGVLGGMKFGLILGPALGALLSREASSMGPPSNWRGGPRGWCRCEHYPCPVFASSRPDYPWDPIFSPAAG